MKPFQDLLLLEDAVRITGPAPFMEQMKSLPERGLPPAGVMPWARMRGQ